ncbi:hypothetical protein PR048_016681 [Dryococelus australis]|uniref:Uncharacterized protein n=1 Tax=Dryococelus australis TaxID=614101 RepID=A0ABQ9H7E7_9NEOP|nr:hypothetical protein PR048_016681 [Dryococelus australis]
MRELRERGIRREYGKVRGDPEHSGQERLVISELKQGGTDWRVLPEVRLSSACRLCCPFPAVSYRCPRSQADVQLDDVSAMEQPAECSRIVRDTPCHAIAALSPPQASQLRVQAAHRAKFRMSPASTLDLSPHWRTCQTTRLSHRRAGLHSRRGDFPTWESCGTIPLIGGFSRRSTISPAIAFRCCSTLASLHFHRLSRPQCFSTPLLQVPSELLASLNKSSARRATQEKDGRRLHPWRRSRGAKISGECRERMTSPGRANKLLKAPGEREALTLRPGEILVARDTRLDRSRISRTCVILLDDAADCRVSSKISRFPLLFHSDAAPRSRRFARVGSRELDLSRATQISRLHSTTNFIKLTAYPPQFSPCSTSQMVSAKNCWPLDHCNIYWVVGHHPEISPNRTLRRGSKFPEYSFQSLTFVVFSSRARRRAVTPSKSRRCQSFSGCPQGGTRQRARLSVLRIGEDRGSSPTTEPDRALTGARGLCELQCTQCPAHGMLHGKRMILYCGLGSKQRPLRDGPCVWQIAIEERAVGEVIGGKGVCDCEYQASTDRLIQYKVIQYRLIQYTGDPLADLCRILHTTNVFARADTKQLLQFTCLARLYRFLQSIHGYFNFAEALLNGGAGNFPRLSPPCATVLKIKRIGGAHVVLVREAVYKGSRQAGRQAKARARPCLTLIPVPSHTRDLSSLMACDTDADDPGNYPRSAPPPPTNPAPQYYPHA